MATSVDDLPDELLALVFSFVPCVRLLSSVARVCHRWHRVQNDERSMPHRPCIHRGTRGSTCAFAAQHGHLNCLVYARERGRPWGVNTFISAVRGANLSVLRYMRKNGCPSPPDAIANALMSKHLQVVWWLRGHAHAWGNAEIHMATSYIDLDGLTRLHREGCPWGDEVTLVREFAARGSVDCVRYALDHGCMLDAHEFADAAYNGHIECLKLAHERGVMNDLVCNQAAIGKHMDCVAYVLSTGYAWTPSKRAWKKTIECRHLAMLALLLPLLNDRKSWYTKIAAKNGWHHALAALHAAGCPLDPSACDHAASSGDLSCLVYVWENGCPWGRNTCKFAVEGGSIECLRYAHENGAKLNSAVMDACRRNRNRECLAYAVEHDCPFA